MSKPTRYYSDKQETMVANYLGFSVVRGSGSDKFAPGDVKSANYLIECKTHMEPTDKIQIIGSHWAQIKNEASVSARHPVLVIDDGTQKPENTWVICRPSGVNCAGLKSYIMPGDAGNSTNLSFSAKYITPILHATQSLEGNNIHCAFVINWRDEDLLLMPLATFKEVMHK